MVFFLSALIIYIYDEYGNKKNKEMAFTEKKNKGASKHPNSLTGRVKGMVVWFFSNLTSWPKK